MNMTPSPKVSDEPVSEERIRNLRAWAAARVGSLSGADIIVSVCDEVVRLRSTADADARDAGRWRWFCAQEYLDDIADDATKWNDRKAYLDERADAALLSASSAGE